MFKFIIFCLLLYFCIAQDEIDIVQDEGEWTDYQGFEEGVYACGAFISIVESQGTGDDVAAYKIGLYGCNARDYAENGQIEFIWDDDGRYIGENTQIAHGSAYCPEDHYVINFKLRVEEYEGSSLAEVDDTSVNGLAILCQNPRSVVQSEVRVEEVMVHEGIWGDWQTGDMTDKNLYVCGAWAKFLSLKPYIDNLALTGFSVKRCEFHD